MENLVITVVAGKLTGELVPCDSSFLIPSSKPGKTIHSRSSSSCGRKLPTSDFGIAAARTSSCNVSCQSRTRNGNNTAASQARTETWGTDWRAQQPKQLPAGLPCESLAGVD